MPTLACAVCSAPVYAATDCTVRVLCAACAPKAKTPFEGLPTWPGARNMMGDEDADEADDDGEEDEAKSKKNKSDDDADDGKFSDKPRGKKPRGKGGDDDDDDDDRPRKKRSGAEEPAKGGMGMGAILGIVGGVLLCCVCLPLGGVAVVFFGGLAGAAGQQTAINNAKQIGLAEHSYHDSKKQFPSPRLDQGDLSWRVALLPYLDQAPLYQKFDQNGAWDKAPNQGLTSIRPVIYDSPLHSPPAKDQTPWQYCTGPNTLFPELTTKSGLARIQDGASNTLLFAEAGLPVVWTRPADIAVTPTGPLGFPSGRFIVCFGDATVRVVNRSVVNDDALRGIINPSDGKLLPPGLD